MKAIFFQNVAQKTKLSNRKLIFAIFLFSFLIRIFYVVSLKPRNISPDGHSWNLIACNIANGNDYGGSWRAPIYSYFLAGIYFLCGDHPPEGLSKKGIFFARILQAIISSFTVVLIFFIGAKIFNETSGLISAFLMSFYPYLIFYAGDILAETIYTFFIALSIYFLLNFLEKDCLKNRALSGISLGLTFLVKGSFLLFYVFVFLWILIKKKNFFKTMKISISIFLFTGLTILPWAVRNSLFYKSFMIMPPGGGLVLWQSNNPLAIKLETTGSIDTEKDRWDTPFEYWPHEREKEIKKLGILEAEKQFKREALAFILINPKDFLRHMKLRFFHFWLLWPRIGSRRNKLIAKCTSAWILPLGWLGIILSLKKYWRETILLIFLIATFNFTHMIFFCNIRYRVPIDPYLIIFAGYTIFRLGKKMGIRLCVESTE